MMLVRRDSEEVCRGVPTCFVRCIVFADFSIIITCLLYTSDAADE